MRLSPQMVLMAAVLLWPLSGEAADLTPQEAPQHIGQTATVCGTVSSAHYAAQARGRPTFLNLGKPFPAETFTVLIWGRHRSAFGTPEKTLAGKRICVTGAIQKHGSGAEIVLRDPHQLAK